MEVGEEKNEMENKFNKQRLFLFFYNFLCVWILFENASSHSCYRFL